MKKGLIKSAIRSVFDEYYSKGLTNTGDKVKKEIFRKIDLVYDKRNKRNKRKS